MARSKKREVRKDKPPKGPSVVRDVGKIGQIVMGTNSKRVIAIGTIGMVLVWAIVGWRYFKSPDVQPVAAQPIIQRIEVVSDNSEAMTALQTSHQELVDQLQSTQDRFASQQADIKRLSDELKLVSGELAKLRGALAKAAPDERPKRKKRRRRG